MISKVEGVLERTESRETVPLMRSSEMKRVLSFAARSLRSSAPSEVRVMRRGRADEEM